MPIRAVPIDKIPQPTRNNKWKETPAWRTLVSALSGTLQIGNGRFDPAGQALELDVLDELKKLTSAKNPFGAFRMCFMKSYPAQKHRYRLFVALSSAGTRCLYFCKLGGTK